LLPGKRSMEYFHLSGRYDDQLSDDGNFLSIKA
jgi:hypothetical protein